MKKLSNFDKKCFKLAIDVAKKTYKHGNYPVGAVLVVDNKIIDSVGNEIKKEKSYANHAENVLIIKNSKLLHKAHNQDKKIKLYSTLEPCIQCLGTSVTNRVSQILFIQKDPHGGACDLKHDNIGVWYKKRWPKIIYCPFTNEPKEMMLDFFHEEIKNGHVRWPRIMLRLLKDTKK
jgi:tRNA(adenine34) deaminase